MSDRIELRGLRVVATHGVLDFEKQRAQPFEVDADIYTNLKPSGDSDNLADTVSYSEVAAVIDDVVRNQSHDLLERVADCICDAVLADTRITEIDVTIRKLRPPVPYDLATAAVHIRRP